MWEKIKAWWKGLFARPQAPVIPLPVPSVPPPVTPPLPSTSPRPRPFDLPPGNHYAGRVRAKMAEEYRYLWSVAELSGAMGKEAIRYARFLHENSARFQRVADTFPGVPWHLFGVISVLEMGLNFNGTILNGDDWSRKTVHFPPGLGPWNSYEEAAEWGFIHECNGWNFNWSTMRWGDPGEYFYFLESWNGHNARTEPQYSLTTPPGASPYIYSGTQFYSKGKKQENPTRFNPELVSQQPGCMAILLALKGLGVEVFPGVG